MFFKKYILKILLYLYNIIFTKGKLLDYYKEAFSINENIIQPECNKVQKYLLSWGYNENITSIPLMNKSDIRTFASKVSSAKAYKYNFTGGSTGEPLKIPVSKRRSWIRTAITLYCNSISGYAVGEPYLAIRSKAKPYLLQWLRNEFVFVPEDLSESNLNKVVNRIINKKIGIIIGYPSVIHSIAQFIEKHHMKEKIDIRLVISSAEPLEKHVCVFIRNTFDCAIIDRYGNEENGIIAFQKKPNSDLCVNRFNLYVEVLDPNTLEPAKEGEKGKVVVTDIYSDLFPMIRYDTGDFAVASEYKDGRITKIRKISGRTIDTFYTTTNMPLNPACLLPSIRLPLTALNELVQFQFVQQSSNEFVLHLKTGSGVLHNDVSNKLKRNLKKYLGDDAIIEIRMSYQIPALLSLKRPLFKNYYIKPEQ